MRGLPILLLVLVLVANVRVVVAGGGYEVHPSIDTNSFIVYSSRTGNVSSLNVYPTSFRIQYTAEYDIVVNGWWCPAWWDPNCDPVNYRYRTVSKEYTYVTPPPQVIEYNGMRILLTYFTSISVLPHASRSWWGWFEEHVKVRLSLYVYGRIDVPPAEPVKIDLGSLIAENISSDRIILQFSVTVERTEPESKNYSIGSSFELLLDGLEITFYKLYARRVSPRVQGAMGIGGYDEEGYIMVAPKGKICVNLCLQGDPGYTLAGTISYTTRYGESEAQVVLKSGRCKSTCIHDVVLMPGNYTGNNKFIISFKSGAMVINLEADTEIPGTMAVVSLPFIVLTYERGDEATNWKAKVYAGVDYTAYKYRRTARVSIHGRISIQGVTEDFTCPTRAFRDKGVYVCEVSLGELDVDPNKVAEAVADVVVSLNLHGVTMEDSATINCSVVSPTSTHGVVATMYGMVSRATFMLILAMAILYILNYMVGFFTGRLLLDPFYISNGLLTCALLASLVFGLPYFHWLVVSSMHSIPEFRSVLTGTPLSNPNQLLKMPPDHVVALLMNFYDMTLTSLKMDYKVWFEEQVSVHLFTRLAVLSVIIGVLMTLSLILMITMNATTAGAVLVPIMGFASTLIGLIIMITPMAGIVQALIALAEFFTAVVAVIVMILFLAGVALSLIPSPTTSRLAEDLLGAGILYMIGVPALAPLLYSLYKYILQILDHYISMVEGVTLLDLLLPMLPFMKLLIPIASIMRMVGYLTIATLISSMIILAQVFVLTRTGIMRGLGEGLLRITRR